VKKKRIELWLAIVGFVLVAPGVAWLCSFRLNRDDLRVAFTKGVRIPLDHLERVHSAAINVTIPDSEQWRRIRRAWGDPGYVLAAASRPERDLFYCFEGLGIRAEVMRGETRIPLETAIYPPYGFSSECNANGLKFHVPPGSELTIRVSAWPQHPLPAGELILMTYWDWGTKDRIVGVMLDEELGKGLRVTSAIGLIMILSAGCLVARRNISSRRTMLGR
jgi:hypothetical protein